MIKWDSPCANEILNDTLFHFVSTGAPKTQLSSIHFPCSTKLGHLFKGHNRSWCCGCQHITDFGNWSWGVVKKDFFGRIYWNIVFCSSSLLGKETPIMSSQSTGFRGKMSGSFREAHGPRVWTVGERLRQMCLRARSREEGDHPPTVGRAHTSVLTDQHKHS